MKLEMKQIVSANFLRMFIIALCFAAPGCTYQGWYTGFQEQQRQQCYQNTMNSADRQQCLDRVNNTTYDQYKVQREQTIERAKP